MMSFLLLKKGTLSILYTILIVGSSLAWGLENKPLKSAQNDITFLAKGSKLKFKKSLMLQPQTTSLIIHEHGFIEFSAEDYSNQVESALATEKEIKKLKNRPACVIHAYSPKYAKLAQILEQNNFELNLYGYKHYEDLIGWSYLTLASGGIYIGCREEMDITLRFDGRFRFYGTRPLVELDRIGQIIKQVATIERMNGQVLQDTIKETDDGVITLKRDFQLLAGQPLYIEARRYKMVSGLTSNFLIYTEPREIILSDEHFKKATCSIVVLEPQYADLLLKKGTRFSFKVKKEMGGAFWPLLISQKYTGLTSDAFNIVCYKSTGFMANRESMTLEEIQEFLNDLFVIEFKEPLQTEPQNIN